jgi:hypothetical protein
MDYKLCLSCGHRNSLNSRFCKCGKRTFILGDGVKLEDGMVFCAKCSSLEFRLLSHKNEKDFHIAKYICTGCLLPIFEKQVYRVDPYKKNAYTECDRCNGRGMKEEEICNKCFGTTTIHESELGI